MLKLLGVHAGIIYSLVGSTSVARCALHSNLAAVYLQEAICASKLPSYCHFAGPILTGCPSSVAMRANIPRNTRLHAAFTTCFFVNIPLITKTTLCAHITEPREGAYWDNRIIMVCLLTYKYWCQCMISISMFAFRTVCSNNMNHALLFQTYCRPA